MPCRDVTEMIEVVVDDQDRLESYRFSKLACGQGVGAQSLLIDQLKGRTVADLLAGDAETFLAEYPVETEVEEFLGLKHLFAVQAALEVLTGREPGGPGDPCAAAEITYQDGKTTIDARIAVDLVTEKIKACGSYKSCGREKKEEALLP